MTWMQFRLIAIALHIIMKGITRSQKDIIDWKNEVKKETGVEL